MLNRWFLEHESDFKPGKNMEGEKKKPFKNKVIFVSTFALEKGMKPLTDVDT